MEQEKDYKDSLHYHSSKKVFKNASLLRQKETKAEQLLWSCLRNRQLIGKKFRRQHAFANYIFDFYCHEKKLAIELDGAVRSDG